MLFLGGSGRSGPSSFCFGWLFSKGLFSKGGLRLLLFVFLWCRGLGGGLGLGFNLVLDDGLGFELSLRKVSGLFCLFLLFLLSLLRRLWRGFNHLQNVRLRGAAQARELAFGEAWPHPARLGTGCGFQMNQLVVEDRCNWLAQPIQQFHLNVVAA